MSIASIILASFVIFDGVFVVAWIVKSYRTRSHQRKYWRCYNSFREISHYDAETLIEELNNDFNNPKILW